MMLLQTVSHARAEAGPPPCVNTTNKLQPFGHRRGIKTSTRPIRFAEGLLSKSQPRLQDGLLKLVSRRTCGNEYLRATPFAPVVWERSFLDPSDTPLRTYSRGLPSRPPGRATPLRAFLNQTSNIVATQGVRHFRLRLFPWAGVTEWRARLLRAGRRRGGDARILDRRRQW